MSYQQNKREVVIKSLCYRTGGTQTIKSVNGVEGEPYWKNICRENYVYTSLVSHIDTLFLPEIYCAWKIIPVNIGGGHLAWTIGYVMWQKMRMECGASYRSTGVLDFRNWVDHWLAGKFLLTPFSRQASIKGPSYIGTSLLNILLASYSHTTLLNRGKIVNF
jgi:hypothetical protein